MKAETKALLLIDINRANQIAKDLFAFPDVKDGSSNKCCSAALKINKCLSDVIKLLNSEPVSKL